MSLKLTLLVKCVQHKNILKLISHNTMGDYTAQENHLRLFTI